MQGAGPADSSAATTALERLDGSAPDIHAAILALLLPPGEDRAVRAWEAETAGVAGAAALRDLVGRLPASARLHWLQTLVSRLRGRPSGSRQALLEATRRLMAATGTIRPLDRLHWVAMRQWLGGAAAAGPGNAASAELARLPQAEVDSIARYTAFLSRMVPIDAAAAGSDVAAGRAWYDRAMQPWRAHATIAPCHPPDTDGLMHALQEIQALAWMQRPMLARTWVTAATVQGPAGRLPDLAADALRLTCSLLDSPLPPELAAHFDLHAPGPPR